MSKAYIDKGTYEGESVYSINLLSEKELQLLTSSLASAISTMENYLLTNIESSDNRNFVRQQLNAATELSNKLKSNT